MIQIISSRATSKQIQQMLESLGIYIKLAVDIERGILAGGGELHADCEQILLMNGSDQATIWGAGIRSSKRSAMSRLSIFGHRLTTVQWRYKRQKFERRSIRFHNLF